MFFFFWIWPRLQNWKLVEEETHHRHLPNKDAQSPPLPWGDATSRSIYIREHFSPTLLYESTQRSHVYSLYSHLLKSVHIYLHLPIFQHWALSSSLTCILPHLLTSVHAYSNIPRSVLFFFYYELSPSTSLIVDGTTKKNKKTNCPTIPSSLRMICIKWKNIVVQDCGLNKLSH